MVNNSPCKIQNFYCPGVGRDGLGSPQNSLGAEGDLRWNIHFGGDHSGELQEGEDGHRGVPSLCRQDLGPARQHRVETAESGQGVNT